MSCKRKAIAQRRVYVASFPGLPSQVFANWKAWERRSERAGTLVMYVGKQDTICKLRPISNIRSILTIRRILLHLHVWRSRVTTAYNSAMHNRKKCQMIQTRPVLPLFISLGPWVSSQYRIAGNFRIIDQNALRINFRMIYCTRAYVQWLAV